MNTTISRGRRFLIRMLGLLLVCALLGGWMLPVSAGLPAGIPAPQGTLDDLQQLEAFLDGVMASQMESNHIPGAVVVVVGNGQVLFSKGYGYADVESRAPVDPRRTLFRPGSISKLFTWTAVMQLVEQGKLSLDADVNSYLDFSIPATWPEPITLRHLMSHTPGFEDRGDGLFKLNADEMIPLGDYLKQNLPVRVFAPGTVGAYSNYGTALAGYIVERVSGMDFAEYVEANIFEPLGMNHATFRQPLPQNIAQDMAGGYNYATAEYVQGGFEYVVPYPAGGLSVAGEDLARFMIAHLQDGSYGEARILQAETARQMHSPLFAHDARLDGMAYGFFASEAGDQRVISHGGDTLLFHSGLWLLPENGTGLAIMTSGTQGYLAVDAVWKAVRERYYPEEPAPLTPTADFQSRAALYAGEYYPARNSFTTFEKLLRITAPVMVTVDEDAVVVAYAGEVDRYVEVEPGLLVNQNEPQDRMVLADAAGQIYLHSSAPFSYIKGGAADSTALHLLILGGGALLFLIALLSWFGALFSREGRGVLRGAVIAARVVGTLFGLAYLAYVIMVVTQMTSIDPAYGAPAVFFGVPAWFAQVNTNLSMLIVLLALLMLVCLVILLWRTRGRPSGKLFYLLLTVSALAIVWSMFYWNMLPV